MSKPRLSDFLETEIETSLMVKGIFKLPLRGLKGFLPSVLTLMSAPLKCPTYTCISKRSNTVGVTYSFPNLGTIVHIVIDVTGLKVYGESEWKTCKQGKEKWRIWRKHHLTVDVSIHEVIVAEVSLVSMGDNEVLPTCLNPLRRRIQQVSVDGAYDTKACYHVLKNQGITPSILPRSKARYEEEGHPRNKSIKALKADEQTE